MIGWIVFKQGTLMYRHIISLLLCALPLILSAGDTSKYREALFNASRIYRLTPPFAEAEGFGAYTQGGAEGKELKVTSLQDDGSEGTLRWAVEQDYPRIITFETEGEIRLENDLMISNPFVTIDSSTAPGKGITITHGALMIHETNDVVLRHLRLRPGFDVDENRVCRNAISIDSSIYVLIDHCSALYSKEELLAIDGLSDFVTVQWSLFSHPENGKCIRAGGRTVSLIKNVFSFFVQHGPLLTGAYPQSKKEVLNNFVYGFTEGGLKIENNDKSNSYHIVGNVYLPASSFRPEGAAIEEKDPMYANVAMGDNQGPAMENNEIEKCFNSFSYPISAEKVAETVRAQAGATLPERGEVDLEVLAEFTTG